MNIKNIFKRKKEEDTIDTRYNRLLNRIEILEKRIKFLEARIKKLEEDYRRLFQVR